MYQTERSVESGSVPSSSRSTRWLILVAVVGAFIGWQAVRHGRARARTRVLREDVNRWEGEGGNVVD